MPQGDDERRLAIALLARAEQERRRLLEEANAEARKVVSDAAAQLASLREARIGDARRRAEQELARRVSEARFRAMSEEARLLEGACRSALEKARAALGALREAEAYAPVLERLLEECLAEFSESDAPLRVVVDPRDRALVAECLKRRSNLAACRLRIEPGGPFLGGLRVSDENESLVVDNTFEARLRARTSAIRRLLGEIFLGGETSR
jgi:vacuolar-type H+-ATPase subunit E/Vma4